MLDCESNGHAISVDCPNETIRLDLERALTEQRITINGIRTLKAKYKLTWRELQVFIRYYLPTNDASDATNRRRLDVANRLGIKEYTVRHHVNVVRSKIGLTRQRGIAMYHWAVANDIVPRN